MSGLTLVAGTLAVGVLPGAVIALVWAPRAELTLLEIAGVGIAVSFVLVQLLAMLAITAHLSPPVMLAVVGAVCLLSAGTALYRRHSAKVVFLLDELILLGVLVVFSALLYGLGSPVDWYEDQVHVAIVRRLSALSAPRLDNLYFSPGIVYTYPFPGTHYFMALVARLTDLDALVVYQKLRFFWGPAAVVMAYLLARAAFGSAAFACGVAMTIVVLTFNGAFGLVPGFASGWGQLMPFSHPSDVAMTVLLPALLTVACRFVLARSRRESSFYLAATIGMATMLTVVHIREAVQFVVYVACFLLASLAVPRFRAYSSRTVAVLALVIGIAATYVGWQGQQASLVADVVADQRARLVGIVASSAIQTLLSSSAPELLGEFVLNSEQLYHGLIPLFLSAMPVVLVLFRQQPIAWLMGTSTALYLLLAYLPVLAIVYIYLTYFEVLFTPVRNFVFFVYLFAGAFLYSIVVGLAHVDRTRLSLILAGTVVGAFALLVSLTINETVSGFIVPLLLADGLAVWWLWSRPHWGRNAASIGAVALMVAGLLALWPQRTPTQPLAQVAVRWSADLPDGARAELEQQFSLGAGEPNSNRSADVNVWNYRLDNTAPDNVRALVTHPEVVDTGGIERDTFTVPPQAPPEDHPYLAVQRIPWMQYPSPLLFVAAAAFVWAIAFLAPAVIATTGSDRAVSRLAEWLKAPFHRHALPFACFIVPFALWTARPTLSPFSESVDALPCLVTDARPAPFSEDLLDGEAVMLPSRTSCPPDATVVEWIREHIATDAVFAIDRWNPWLPSVFIPQQVVVYPQVEVTFENEDRLFANYSRFYAERMRRARVQPFFNAVESPAERAAFVDALGVTHVLVDPPYFAEMRAVLDALPQQYALRFSEGQWAVYEVLRRSERRSPGV